MKLLLTNQSLPGCALTSNSFQLLCLSGACLGKEALSIRKQMQCPGALSPEPRGKRMAVQGIVPFPRHCQIMLIFPSYCYVALWTPVSCAILCHIFQHYPISWKLSFKILFQWLLPRIHSISIFPLHVSKGHEGSSPLILPTEWVHLL